MGIAQQEEGEESADESQNDLDESYRPSNHPVTSRWRSSFTLRSGQVRSQRQHTIPRQIRRAQRAANNRQREIRFQRRHTGVINIDSTTDTTSIDVSSFLSSPQDHRSSVLDSDISQNHRCDDKDNENNNDDLSSSRE